MMCLTPQHRLEISGSVGLTDRQMREHLAPEPEDGDKGAAA